MTPNHMTEDPELVTVIASLPRDETAFQYLGGCWKRERAERYKVVLKKVSRQSSLIDCRLGAEVDCFAGFGPGRSEKATGSLERYKSALSELHRTRTDGSHHVPSRPHHASSSSRVRLSVVARKTDS